MAYEQYYDQGASLYGTNPEMAALYRRRKLSEALSKGGTDTSPVATPLAGLARALQGAVGAYGMYSADKDATAAGEKMEAGRRANNELFMTALAPGGSQGPPSAMAQGLDPSMAQPAPRPQPANSLQPFTAQNLPQGIDPVTDQIVRTTYGEARGESPEGQRAVAAVIRNRANQSGQSPTDVIFAPNQFEPWNNPQTRKQLESLDPNSPEYQAILKNIQPTLQGVSPDPTNGATHFYSPKAQAALGRQAPSWAAGDPTVIGGHNFYNVGYKPGVAARTGGVDVAGPGAPSAPQGGMPPQPGPDVSAMTGQIQRMQATGIQLMNSQDPRTHEQGKFLLQRAAQMEQQVQAVQTRADQHAFQRDERIARQQEAAANRTPHTVTLQGEDGTNNVHVLNPDGTAGAKIGTAPKQPGDKNLDPRTVIADIGPKVRDGKATQQEIDKYNTAASDYMQPRTITNERGTFVITPQLPPGMPQPRAAGAETAPTAAGLPPGVREIKNTERDPPQQVATGLLANAQNLKGIDQAIESLQGYKEAIGPGNYMRPGPLKNWLDPKGVEARARIADLSSMILHDRAGTAMTKQELDRVRPFIPEDTDTYDVAMTKLTKLRMAVHGLVTDTYSAYGPKSGYRKLDGVDEALGGGKSSAAPPPGGPSAADIDAELKRRGLVK